MNIKKSIMRICCAVLFAAAAGASTFADVATNCFHTVEYGSLCTHFACDVPGFTFVRFSVNVRPTEISICDHGGDGVSFVANSKRHHWVSYLDFPSDSLTITFSRKTDVYCAFTFNNPRIEHSTADYLGWFHFRLDGDKVELVSSAFETSRGQRIEIAPAGWPGEEVEEDAPETPEKSEDDVVISDDGKELISVPSWMAMNEIPDGIEVIGKAAFVGCQRISKLTIPASVRLIREDAFADTYISCFVFKGDAPELESDALYGLLHAPEIRAKIGTRGWPNNGKWQGFPLATEGVELNDSDEFQREREGADGSVWMDTVNGRCYSKLSATRNNDGLYQRYDSYWWNTNIVTRQTSPVASSEYTLSDGYRSIEIEYWDLEHPRTYSAYGWWTDYNLDISKGGVFDQIYREYDQAGRVLREKTNVQYDYDAIAKHGGVCEVVEQRECQYGDDGLVCERVEKETTYQDLSQATEDRYIYFTYDESGSVCRSDEFIKAVDTNGVERSERHQALWDFYDVEMEGVIERQNETTCGKVTNWDRQTETFNKDGELVSVAALSGRAPSGAKIPCYETLINPGSSVTVAAKSEIEALWLVAFKCAPPVVNGAAVVATDDYLGYLRHTATEVSEGEWIVSCDIDPDAIVLGESLASLGGQIAEIASGAATEINIPAKPGLYYGLGYSEFPAGPYRCDAYVLAEGATVSLPLPPPKTTSLFMRIQVSTKE